LAFSFLRGEIVEAMYHFVTRMGMVVNKAKKIHVFVPPPTFQESQRGTKAIAEMRIVLEKDSLPAASAGKGAFLIVGYCTDR
jgi:hypothetical protein